MAELLVLLWAKVLLLVIITEPQLAKLPPLPELLLTDILLEEALFCCGRDPIITLSRLDFGRAFSSPPPLELLNPQLVVVVPLSVVISCVWLVLLSWKAAMSIVVGLARFSLVLSISLLKLLDDSCCCWLMVAGTEFSHEKFELLIVADCGERRLFVSIRSVDVTISFNTDDSPLSDSPKPIAD